MFVSTVHFPCLYWAQILFMNMQSPSMLMVSSDMLMYWQLHPFVTHCTMFKYHAKGQHVMLLCDVTVHCGLLISNKIGYLCLRKQFDAFIHFFKIISETKILAHKRMCVLYFCATFL